MITRTVIFPISLKTDEKAILDETSLIYTQAYKHCVNIAWEMKSLTAVKLHNATYKNLKEKLGLKSQYLCSARNRALENIRSLRALKRKGKKISKPQKQRVPIRLDARTLSFDKSKETASIATQKKRIKISLKWHKQALRYKDWECLAGEIGKDRKGKWVLRLIFKTDLIKPEKTGRIIGVDRGIKHAAVCSNNQFLGKAKDREHESKLIRLRSRLQAEGTRSAHRHLKKLSGRLKRFKQNVDRILAKELLSFLNPGDIVVLENLTDIKKHCGTKRKARKKHRIHMGRWSFKRLENAIKYLAELKGVYVEYVDPRYTSQTCSRCSLVSKKSRKSQSFFSCLCGLKLNADLNAARIHVKKWYMANGYLSGPSVNWPIVASLFRPSYKLLTSVRSS